MKKVIVDLTIRVEMEIPETMEIHEAVSELDYSIIGDEDDCVVIGNTEIIDFETIKGDEHIEYMGRLYKVESTFAEHDQAAANAFMEANPETSLLTIKDGVAYIVRTDDHGTPVA